MTTAIPPASTTKAGVVSTGTQSFTGDKTFTGRTTIQGPLVFGTANTIALTAGIHNALNVSGTSHISIGNLAATINDFTGGVDGQVLTIVLYSSGAKLTLTAGSGSNQELLLWGGTQVFEGYGVLTLVYYSASNRWFAADKPSPHVNLSTINTWDGGTLTISDTDTNVGTDELLCAINLKTSDPSNASGVGTKLAAYSRNSIGSTTGFAISTTLDGVEKTVLSSNILGTVEVYGAGEGNGSFVVRNESAAANATAYCLAAQYVVDADCTGGYFLRMYNSAGATIGRIEAASNTTVAYQTSSDERLKQNPSSFTALPTLMQLAPKEFEWKSNPEKRDYGLYAQEVYPLIPSVVSVGSDDLTADGSISLPWGISYAGLVPWLIKGIQELKAENNALEARIAALENPV